MSYQNAIDDIISESERLFALFMQTRIKRLPVPKFKRVVFDRDLDLGFEEESVLQKDVDPLLVTVTMGEMLVGQGFVKKPTYNEFDDPMDFNCGRTIGWNNIHSFSASFNDRYTALSVVSPGRKGTAAAFFRAAQNLGHDIDLPHLPNDPAVSVAYTQVFKAHLH